MSRRKGNAEPTVQERLKAAEDQVEDLLKGILDTIPVLAGKRKEIINLRRSITALERGAPKQALETVPAAGANEAPRERRAPRFRDRDAALEAAKATAAKSGTRPWKRPRRGGK